MQQAFRENAEISSAGSESLAEGPIDEEHNLGEEQQTNGVGGKDAGNELERDKYANNYMHSNELI